MMYVKVMYKNDRINSYCGQAYTYKTDLPLKLFDKVIANAAGEDKKALVLDIDVPEAEIDPAWADRVKEITQYDTDY